MPNDFFNDIKATVLHFVQLRKKRKADNAESNVVRIPVYVMKPAFYNTVEGCRLSNCGKKADKAGLAAFRAMPYEMQRAMERFTPETAEFIERAMLWQEYLRQAAPGKDGHAAMVGILSWYRHIKHMRKHQYWRN